jgi:hypothetical protein
MTKQLQKKILKHLENNVSILRVSVFNYTRDIEMTNLDSHKKYYSKLLSSSTNQLKKAEKYLSEFKKLYPIK